MKMGFIKTEVLTLMHRDAPLPDVKEPGEGTTKVRVSNVLK